MLSKVSELLPRLARWLIVVSLVLNLGVWLVALWFYQHYHSDAILHYTVEIGIDFIDKGLRIFNLPLAGLGLLGLNTLLGMLVYTTERRLAWILWSPLPILQLMFFFTFWLLLRINATSF